MITGAPGARRPRPGHNARAAWGRDRGRRRPRRGSSACTTTEPPFIRSTPRKGGSPAGLRGRWPSVPRIVGSVCWMATLRVRRQRLQARSPRSPGKVVLSRSAKLRRQAQVGRGLVDHPVERPAELAEELPAARGRPSPRRRPRPPRDASQVDRQSPAYGHATVPRDSCSPIRGKRSSTRPAMDSSSNLATTTIRRPTPGLRRLNICAGPGRRGDGPVRGRGDSRRPRAGSAGPRGLSRDQMRRLASIGATGGSARTATSATGRGPSIRPSRSIGNPGSRRRGQPPWQPSNRAAATTAPDSAAATRASTADA